MRRRWVQMIAQLDEMFVERLLDFKARNAKKLPSNIVFWRDGVSEGQFDQVIRDELPLIQKAFADKAFSPNPAAPYKPNLTIVICGSCVALRRELSLMVRGRDRQEAPHAVLRHGRRTRRPEWEPQGRDRC
jgi:hypothetical protein